MKYCNPRNKNIVFYTMLSLVCLAVLCAALWLVLGPLFADTQINWSMHSAWFPADGQLEGTPELSITGSIRKDPEKRDVLTLSISLPDDIPYSFSESGDFYSMSDEIDSMPYFVCSGYTLGKETNAPSLCYFALDEEKQQAVFFWPDDPGQYLAASADSGVDPKQIVSHFQTFLEIYRTDK